VSVNTSVHQERLQAHPVNVPPGYPREFERELRLKDGRRVFARPVVPEDRDQLERAIRDADPQTLRRRFLGGPPPLRDDVLRRLTTLDYVRRFAVAAADAETGQGVALPGMRPREKGVAEVAVAAAPDGSQPVVAVGPARRSEGSKYQCVKGPPATAFHAGPNTLIVSAVVGPLAVGGDGGRQGGEDVVGPDPFGQPVRIEVIEQVPFDPGEGEDDASAGQLGA